MAATRNTTPATIDAAQPMTWVVLSDPLPAGASVLGSGLGRDSAIALAEPQAPSRVRPESRAVDPDTARPGPATFEGRATDAVRASDALEITAVDASSSGLTNTVTWASKTNRVYNGDIATNILAGFTTIASNVVPSGASTAYAHPNAGAPRTFYRIAVRPPP